MHLLLIKLLLCGGGLFAGGAGAWFGYSGISSMMEDEELETPKTTTGNDVSTDSQSGSSGTQN